MGRIGKVLGFSRLKETALRHSEWDADGSRARMRIWIERRVIRGYECSGCGRRTWRVRDARQRTWDDLPWAAHPVTLVYAQRRVRCRHCGIRTERIDFADPKARVTRRLRQDSLRLALDADPHVLIAEINWLVEFKALLLLLDEGPCLVSLDEARAHILNARIEQPGVVVADRLQQREDRRLLNVG